VPYRYCLSQLHVSLPPQEDTQFCSFLVCSSECQYRLNFVSWIPPTRARSTSTSGSIPSLCKISRKRATSSGSYPLSTLCNKQQQITMSGTNVTCKSIVSRSSLKLCLRMPKAFSTSLRPLDNFLLNIRSSTDLCPARPAPSL
jgi:hypothetical protein